MERLSNRRTITILVGAAVAAFVASGLLDHHSNWGDLRQAVANVSWIVFVLCALTLIVLGVRTLIVRVRHSAA